MGAVWAVVAVIAAVILAWLPTLARDEWRAIDAARPAPADGVARSRRIRVAALYAGSTLWLLAVLWLVLSERLLPILPVIR